MQSRPWWGVPRMWLIVAAISLVIGLVIWPRVFGFTFLFVPFIWLSRGRARRSANECPSCGSRLDPSFAYCPRCGAPAR